MVMQHGASTSLFGCEPWAAIASTVDHETSRNIKKACCAPVISHQPAVHQFLFRDIDVLNTLCHFFARPPNPAGHTMGWSAAPMSPELMLLGACSGISSGHLNCLAGSACNSCHYVCWLMSRTRLPKKGCTAPALSPAGFTHHIQADGTWNEQNSAYPAALYMPPFWSPGFPVRPP
jgi:hypothetical protein